MIASKLITNVEKISEIFQKSKKIENPFSSLILMNGDEVLISEYTDYLCAEFFPFLQSLLNSTGEKSCYFLTLEPEPIDYFFQHFNKYPAFEIATDTTKEEYFETLHFDPGNPADALAHNARTFVIFPLSLKWYIYGDGARDLSVLRMPFNKAKLLELKQAYPFEPFTWEEAIARIDENLGN